MWHRQRSRSKWCVHNRTRFGAGLAALKTVVAHFGLNSMCTVVRRVHALWHRVARQPKWVDPLSVAMLTRGCSMDGGVGPCAMYNARTLEGHQLRDHAPWMAGKTRSGTTS